MNILVLGSNGMIGNAIFSLLYEQSDLRVTGSLRNKKTSYSHLSYINDKYFIEIDPFNLKIIESKIETLNPDLVINCIGLTKHVFKRYSKKIIEYINSDFPHFLANFSDKYNFRLIQISTDCVFEGLRGNYSEKDLPDAKDLYGKTKYRGEVINYSNVITIRTSTIGHEIQTKYGLLEWFLMQKECYGFCKAFFSGLTNIELAKIIRDLIIPNEHLNGLHHVGGYSISKYNLLMKINEIYKKNIVINKENHFKINRSLNSKKFKTLTRYIPKGWDDLIEEMKDSNRKFRIYSNV